VFSRDVLAGEIEEPQESESLGPTPLRRVVLVEEA